MAPIPDHRRKQAQRECAEVDKWLKAGHPPQGLPGSNVVVSAVRKAGDTLGVHRLAFAQRIGLPTKPGTWERNFGIKPDWKLYKGPSAEKLAAEKATARVKEKAAAELGGSPKDKRIIQLEDKIRRLEAALKEAHREQLTTDGVREILGVLAKTPSSPPDWLLTPKRGKAPSPEAPMTIWSDWHAGEVVEADEVNGVNKFSVAIFEQRVRRLVENTINLCKNHHRAEYPGIVVNLLGDFVSGGIHPELVQSDEVPVPAQVLKARDVLVWALKAMIEAFGKVYCPCSAGNHARDTDRPEYKDYVEKSWDWLIYQLLVREFQSDARIRFDVPASNDVHYQVFGWKFLATHGDMLGVKGGDGIIGAIGPITRGEVKTSRQHSAFGQDYDFVCMGHWHQSLWLPRAIVNNALKGFDQYAHKVLRAVPSAPSQSLWFVHPRRGITARWNVLVEEQEPRSTQWVSVFQDRAA